MFDKAVVGIRDDDGGRDALELAGALLSGGGEVIVVAPSARRDLHTVAASRGADLIVIRASGGKRLEHRLRGDDVRELLADPPCAVAVAPVGYSTRSDRAITKVGVAYDASPQSERALALARTIAAELGATLSAFEAVPPRLGPADLGNPASRIEKDVNAARRRIAALGEVEAHAELADDTVDALRWYARSVDLLVLGAHKHRPLDRHLKRSKSQRLAQNPPSALLCLPPRKPASARRAPKRTARG